MFVLALVLGQVVFSPVAAAQTVPPAPGNVVVELGGFKSVDEIGLTGAEGDSNRQLREGGKILKVSWDEVVSGSPTGYRVQWREASASDWSAAQHRDVDGASTTSYQIGTATDGLLANGTAYEIRVYTRYGTNGLSAASSVVSATPLTANQQLHNFVEEIVERANAAPNKMPWMRAGFENMPFVGDTEYRDFRVAEPGRLGYLFFGISYVGNFFYSLPAHIGVEVGKPSSAQGNLIVGHELHHAYFIVGHRSEMPMILPVPNDIPAGRGIALADAVGYLYLRDLVATNTKFSGCGPTYELFADLAGGFLEKMLTGRAIGLGYWAGCGRSPMGADKALFSMFDEIFAGEVPDW
ncbi:MAG: fibronectin type III domain-containing protein, partial [bacterium]|nr:fibronectin type III domain-containing protein [bacterium]